MLTFWVSIELATNPCVWTVPVMNLRRRNNLSALMALILFGAACSTEDGLGEGATSAAAEPVMAERHGSLVAEFVYPRSWESDGVSIQAQFLDARGVSVESALQALEVWTPVASLERADCVMLPLERTRSSEPVSLSLLDLGELEVVAPEGAFYLPPRRLPDLLSAFYGVVYGSEWTVGLDRELLDFYPGAIYGFSAPGSALAGGFDVALRAPEPIVLIALNGEEVRGTGQELGGARDLELVWEPDGAADVEVYIDVATGFGPDQPRLQCRTADTGAFTVPEALVGSLLERGQAVDLELRRVRRVEAPVEGLDAAEFLFSTMDRVELF